MRNSFFNKLEKKFLDDKRLFLLTGDTGYNLVENFMELFPNRALNVGVAEQNMVGIASGLVNVGYIPVCYAITNFLVQRSFEQIRNDICLHEYKVILIGTSTGYDNGALGPTHHKLDDIGSLKALPNLNIYSPSSEKSLWFSFENALESEHGSFIRITKGGLKEEQKIDKPNYFVRKNDDNKLIIISHGKMVSNALEAYNLTPTFSIFAMDQIKPLDNKSILEIFMKYKTIIILEDNFKSGLFNSICQWYVENFHIYKKIISIAPKTRYEKIIGDAEYLEHENSLSPIKIKIKIDEILNERN